ncbi:MAG: response regulator, partial [Salinivirgaceae bacterium]|nr:response regulator [Salinivirgaceae bacterium]
ILNNLLSNAVKFTNLGNITLSVKVIKRDIDAITLLFSVKDTGIGIAKEKLHDIFNSFQQESSSTTRKYGGTGLGLTISKQLVELQEGKMSVESKKNEGSTFSFHITYRIPPRSAIEKEFLMLAEEQKAAHKLKAKQIPPEDILILLAEDNMINQNFATTILRKNKYSVDVAEDGVKVLKLLEQNRYDLILMDLHMPEKDGYETTTIIRNSATAYKNIPIIAVTAAAIKGEKERCFNEGMNAYISKPYDPTELIEKISKVLDTQAILESEKVKPEASLKLTNLNYIKSAAGNDKTLINEFVNIFIKQIPDFISSFNQFFTNKNFEQLAKTAHTAKPSLAMMGMNELSDDIKKMEQLAREEKNIAEIEKLISKFENETKLAQLELENFLKLPQ